MADRGSIQSMNKRHEEEKEGKATGRLSIILPSGLALSSKRNVSGYGARRRNRSQRGKVRRHRAHVLRLIS